MRGLGAGFGLWIGVSCLLAACTEENGAYVPPGQSASESGSSDAGSTSSTSSTTSTSTSTSTTSASTTSTTTLGSTTDPTTGPDDGVCGDGVMDADEACDDGNADETDACASTCVPPGCGDGVVQEGEDCDHGPANADDAACTSACKKATCGDSLLGPGEACDPPADMMCTDMCALTSCDGMGLDVGEACDGSPGCTPTCLLNTCGDGFQIGDEGCDDGNLQNGDGCTATCRKVECGDGQVVEGELCDDGNQTPLDGCHGCARDAYFLFVTEEKFTGDLGGLKSADTKCQNSAEAAGLTGTFRAWLSDGTSSPAMSFSKSKLPYILPGTHERVANDWIGLVTGALKRPIDRTAAGDAVEAGSTCEATGALAWTHTKATGGPFKGAPCSGWLTSLGDAVAGLVHEDGLPWTEGCPAIPCSKALRLYCVEQP